MFWNTKCRKLHQLAFKIRDFGSDHNLAIEYLHDESRVSQYVWKRPEMICDFHQKIRLLNIRIAPPRVHKRLYYCHAYNKLSLYYFDSEHESNEITDNEVYWKKIQCSLTIYKEDLKEETLQIVIDNINIDVITNAIKIKCESNDHYALTVLNFKGFYL